MELQTSPIVVGCHTFPKNARHIFPKMAVGNRLTERSMLQLQAILTCRWWIILKRLLCWFLAGALVSGCSNQNFKADEPVDYRDNARYGFGSLIKGERAPLKKYLDKKDISGNEIVVEKVAANNPKDKLWNSTIIALKDFPIDFMDKKVGKLETGMVKVKLFDSTETCTYKIVVQLRGEASVDVVVTSHEDSAVRLKKHAETIKSKILEEYRK